MSLEDLEQSLGLQNREQNKVSQEEFREELESLDLWEYLELIA